MSKVYAMSDIPKLLYSASTIHMKGRVFFPTSGPHEQQVVVGTEYWLDLANGRWRLTVPSYSIDRREIKVTVTEYICDGGEYSVTLNHTEKTASYSKVSEYQRQLFNYRNIQMLLYFACGRPGRLDDCKIIREEKIDGHTYNVWELLTKHSDGLNMKLRSWLSPTTGEFARTLLWRQQEDGDWLKQIEIDYVQRDIEIPDKTFSTQVPSGYMLENTKETATTRSLRRVWGRTDSVTLSAHVLFTMGDGTVIACWSSEDSKAEISQAELFKGLTTGGELPKLPFEVYALQSSRNDEDITYRGYHFAYTKKADEFYEWSIYIPPKELKPARTQFLCYLLEYRHNIENREVRGKLRLSTTAELTIENSKDFDKFVRGAMEELSDGGKAPDEATYENVLRLSQNLRLCLSAFGG
ncbi:MAG TPA: hypothetical protein VMW16_11075 [Sedimentisphaerales bacterium]|nr:hypothetical protein [Sedimentisphaerales bacterium]